jgi:hypothetical protein
MIMTDVRLRPNQVFKGDRSMRDITFTLMGGTVGETTVLIIGGPELDPGSDYILFLNREPLHAGREALTVRDLSQGAFEIADLGAGRRVFSQALSHPLLPDETGAVEPPGGRAGMTLDDLFTQIRRYAGDR